MKECTIMFSVMVNNWVIAEDGHFNYKENFETAEQAVISAYRKGYTTIKIETK
jgi:hypothetical protein